MHEVNNIYQGYHGTQVMYQRIQSMISSGAPANW